MSLVKTTTTKTISVDMNILPSKHTGGGFRDEHAGLPDSDNLSGST